MSCSPDDAPSEAPRWSATFAIADRGGIYRPPDLECDGDGGSVGSIDYVAGTRGEVGDPVEIARREPFVRPDDVVEGSGIRTPRSAWSEWSATARVGRFSTTPPTATAVGS